MTTPAKKPRGRPRTATLSPADRMGAWRDLNTSQGGKTLQIHLTPNEWRALQLLSNPRGRSGKIGELIVREAHAKGLEFFESGSAATPPAADSRPAPAR